ncbi:hypothetical protein N0V95_000520 [Ascochyta clinopodiicola]|nr:hypothetical protein N0V95_000520 [Ascochyta clinopodiicola]
MKGTWEPEWYRSGRQPAFVGEGPPLAMFGNKKYLWGNMPALDILQLQNNESETRETSHDFNLLFAASGDLRNTIKTIAGLQEGYEAAKADEFGAIFFHIQVLLLKFCSRLRTSNISFRLFNMDARDIGHYLDDMKFDRIEISNICDRGYVGPHTCLQVFAQLLKSNSQNPKATLLMLFINAAMETDHIANPQGDVSSLVSAMKSLEKYITIDKSRMSLTRSGMTTKAHPDLILRTACYDMFKPWDKYFDMFMDEAEITQFAELCGVVIKKKHTIVQPWPEKFGIRPQERSSMFCVLVARQDSSGIWSFKGSESPLKT